MNIYKVMFANNEVAGSQVADQRFDHDSEYYYEYMGKIMYAMIKASNKEEAEKAAKKLVLSAIQPGNHILPPYAAAA